MADEVKTETRPEEKPPEKEKKGRSWMFWAIVGLGAIVGVFVLSLIAAVIIALVANPKDAANWIGIIRDIFIIVVAMEGMLMGIAMIVLVIQLAALINLLQNEVQPIVDNANDTVSTVKGTTKFISQNLVEPVVKFSAVAAGFGAVVREMIGIRQSLANGNGHKGDSGRDADKKE